MLSPDVLVALRDIGIAGIALLVVLVLARTLQQQTKSAGDKDVQENNILKQMIDLATSYKTESAEARDAYRMEAAATRAVVQESNDALRGVTHATNEQTAEIRLLRSDFKDYQTINADEIENFGISLETFKAEVSGLIQNLVTVVTNNAEHANRDRDEMHRKLDRIIDLYIPKAPPPVNAVDAPPDLKASS